VICLNKENRLSSENETLAKVVEMDNWTFTTIGNNTEYTIDNEIDTIVLDSTNVEKAEIVVNGVLYNYTQEVIEHPYYGIKNIVFIKLQNSVSNGKINLNILKTKNNETAKIKFLFASKKIEMGTITAGTQPIFDNKIRHSNYVSGGHEATLLKTKTIMEVVGIINEENYLDKLAIIIDGFDRYWELQRGTRIFNIFGKSIVTKQPKNIIEKADLKIKFNIYETFLTREKEQPPSVLPIANPLDPSEYSGEIARIEEKMSVSIEEILEKIEAKKFTPEKVKEELAKITSNIILGAVFKLTGTLQTSELVNTGVKITSDGIYIYNADNELVFNFDSNTQKMIIDGSGHFSGDITGASGIFSAELSGATLVADEMLVLGDGENNNYLKYIESNGTTLHGGSLSSTGDVTAPNITAIKNIGISNSGRINSNDTDISNLQDELDSSVEDSFAKGVDDRLLDLEDKIKDEMAEVTQIVESHNTRITDIENTVVVKQVNLLGNNSSTGYQVGSKSGKIKDAEPSPVFMSTVLSTLSNVSANYAPIVHNHDTLYQAKGSYSVIGHTHGFGTLMAHHNGTRILTGSTAGSTS